VAADDIDAWLVGDSQNPPPERPSGVYPGDTITITAFRDASAAKPAPVPVEEGTDEEYERQPDGEGDGEEEEDEDETSGAEAEAEAPEEFVDESNPFYVKKKKEPEGPTKPVYKDTSDAANDILRKMMERRRSGGDR